MAKQSWARGGTILAATLLLLIGIYQFFVGLAAVVQDNFFVVGANYTYEIDTTAWGWIHMAIGVIAAITGFTLFTGATWARIVAIGICVISAVANFFFLPYYPLWALLLIGLDIFAIWAIANVRTRNEFEPTAAAAGMGAGTAGGYRDQNAQTGERWPAENVSSGRHATDNVKEGVGQGQTMGQDQGMGQQSAQERAEAAARGGTSGGTYTAGPGGVTPPNNPPA